MALITVIELTDEQKIQILEKAKELLGPNGEHWTKSCWWGIKRSDSELVDWLFENDYIEQRVMPDDQTLEDIKADTEHEAERKALDTSRADEANVWCLVGALEEAAYRLGIVQERDASERLTNPVSLQKLVENKEEWEGWSVIDVNDKESTEWSDIEGLLDERLAELRAT